MTSSRWSLSDAVSALSQVIGFEDEVVFIHSNLALLGRTFAGNSAETMFDALRTFTNTTFVLPAFDYSFGRNEVFDVQRLPTQMGALTKKAFGQSGVLRSVDPMFSCLVFGQNASKLISNLPARSFGPDSLFDRVLRSKGSFLSINLDLGSTLCHELEHRFRVPFRFEKTFSGTFVDEPKKKRDWISYVRDLDLVGAQNFALISKSLESSGLVKEARLGRGTLRAVEFSKYSDHISSMLKEDPWVMISKLDVSSKTD